MADPVRQQQRLDYLKRVRPNDPEIKKLQAALKPPAGGGGATDPRVGSGITADTPLNTPQEVYMAGFGEAQRVAEAGNVYNNPNLQGPFGSSQWTVGPDGRPMRTDSLSAGNQGILDSGQELTNMGLDYAQQNLRSSQLNQAYDPMGQGGVGADRSRIEDEIFGRLTRDLERDRGREKQALEQQLVERGIPLDPGNPLYQRFMGDLNQRFDDQMQGARAQAVQMGGDELSRNFQVDLGTRQQQVGEVAGLGQVGVGLQVPTVPGFNAPGFQAPDLAGTVAAVGSLQEQRRANRASEALSRLRANNSGGGGAAPVPASPFNNTLPPVRF